MLTNDRVVAVVGAIVVVTVLAGLVVVEQRNGPFHHALAPAEVDAHLLGTVRTAGPTTPVGTPCTTPTPACEPPRTEVDLRVRGLPPLGGDLRYVVHLTGAERPLPLGALASEGGDHVLRYGADVDGRGASALVVSLTPTPTPDGPSPFVVLDRSFDTGGGTAALDATVAAALAPVQGSLAVAQVGAVEVSATAAATVRGLAFHDGWTYRAWFVAGQEHTELGALAEAEPGVGVLDVRRERVVLADQERFLVTLEPSGGDPSDAPVGFPVVTVGL